MNSLIDKNYYRYSGDSGTFRVRRLFLISLCFVIFKIGTVASSKPVKCMENGRFYRDPSRPAHTMWTPEECSKYFLCLEGEIFEFKCSSGLLFDVDRQICDFQTNVDNCEISAEMSVPKPLLKSANCPKEDNLLGCADGTCLPEDYFCDGSPDCPDASDEGHCNPNNDTKRAKVCDSSVCKLPECFCSTNGDKIPKNLTMSQTPQMIILSFDDAINDENYELYKMLLASKEFQNPNQCQIKATFFVSHQFNDYYYTQKLWNDGHEIAVHSITHRGPEDWWSLNATVEDWFDEMVGQANILHKFSHLRLAEVRGMRAPFLKVGWNRQFLMMKEFGFLYDSSIIAPFSEDKPLWPYTLDYRIPHACEDQVCPSRNYSGIWEMVLNPLEAGPYICQTLSACTFEFSRRDIYELLFRNFNRHHTSTKAPFTLHLQSAWFKSIDNFNAFFEFLEDVLQYPDVWVVTNWQAIQWMKNPVPLEEIKKFKPWQCDKKRNFEKVEKVCDSPNECKLYSRVFQEERIMRTCSQCPQNYPWIRNEFGID